MKWRNELWRRWSDGMCSDVDEVTKWALLILQPFRDFTYVKLILQSFCRFTYVIAHFPTIPLLNPRHSSFSNPSVALPMSQLILQPFHCFTYVMAHSPTLPGLYLCHSSFSNLSFASPTSQALHLRHLASLPCHTDMVRSNYKFQILSWKKTTEDILWETM